MVGLGDEERPHSRFNLSLGRQGLAFEERGQVGPESGMGAEAAHGDAEGDDFAALEGVVRGRGGRG